jgi:hypothetical protein
MGKTLDPKETASFEEILLSNVLTQEAIIRILERKGILTRDELVTEIIEMKDKKGSE